MLVTEERVKSYFAEQEFGRDMWGIAYTIGSELLKRPAKRDKQAVKRAMSALIPETRPYLHSLAGKWLARPGAIEGVSTPDDIEGIFYAKVVPKVAKSMVERYQKAQVEAEKKDNPSIVQRTLARLSGRTFFNIASTAIENELRSRFNRMSLRAKEFEAGRRRLEEPPPPLLDRHEKKALRDVAKRVLDDIKKASLDSVLPGGQKVRGKKGEMVWYPDDYKFLKALIGLWERADEDSKALARRNEKRQRRGKPPLPSFYLSGIFEPRSGGGAPAVGLIKKAIQRSGGNITSPTARKKVRQFTEMFYKALLKHPVGKEILPRGRKFVFKKLPGEKVTRFVPEHDELRASLREDVAAIFETRPSTTYGEALDAMFLYLLEAMRG